MKYRVWCKRQNKYFKQGEFETFVWIDDNGKPVEVEITVHGTWINPKDVSDLYEIEYSHGHKDINGVVIYNNDIMKRTITKEIERAYSKYTYPYNTIIGNKNENPELWASL